MDQITRIQLGKILIAQIFRLLLVLLQFVFHCKQEQNWLFTNPAFLLPPFTVVILGCFIRQFPLHSLGPVQCVVFPLRCPISAVGISVLHSFASFYNCTHVLMLPSFHSWISVLFSLYWFLFLCTIGPVYSFPLTVSSFFSWTSVWVKLDQCAGFSLHVFTPRLGSVCWL
jgi:hypothetical protein